MATKRSTGDTPNSHAENEQSKPLRASTGRRNSPRTRRTAGPLGLSWTVRTDETHTAVTADGLVCVVGQVVFTRADGQTSDGHWYAQVTGNHGVSLMQASDEDRDVAFAAVGDFLRALSIARERDPQPR